MNFDVTDERKRELVYELESSVNRWLDKQWIVADAIDMIVENKNEKLFLQSTNCNFSVEN